LTLVFGVLIENFNLAIAIKFFNICVLGL
jgi:hypothetical protein